MNDFTILVTSWSDGVFVLSSDTRQHELQGCCVAGLVSDGCSGAVAVVDGSSLMRRSSDGVWTELAAAEVPMECCLVVDGVVYAGTRGAHMLRVSSGKLKRVKSFDVMDGRASWFAGSAVVDGKVMGPPLGVRSLASASDGRTLLAGIHVGGIARSLDGGMTWHPTIAIEWDVHEVCAHPSDPQTVIAACAVGLCVSLDGGESWVLESPDSAETYCSAVAFLGQDLLVSVSDGHFAPHSTVLRRSIDSPGTLRVAGGGLPDRLVGIVDTGCIASRGSDVAVVDSGGHVYASDDAGRRWSLVAEGIPDPSSALILRSMT